MNKQNLKLLFTVFTPNVLFTVNAAMVVVWLDHQMHTLMTTQVKIFKSILI